MMILKEKFCSAKQSICKLNDCECVDIEGPQEDVAQDLADGSGILHGTFPPSSREL